MLARVSNLEAFRYWRESEDAELEPLLASIREESPPSSAMAAGTALHAALETAQEGECDVLYAEGYKFIIRADVTLALPRVREIRGYKNYGPLRVTGKVDCIEGKRVDDHKSTGRFDPERYIEGYQWRYYLDLFDADRFRWNVFEMDAVDDYNHAGPAYEVFAFHQLEQFRYPGLHQDCATLAADFYEFARAHNLTPRAAA